MSAAPAPSAPALRIEGLSKAFGGLAVTRDVSLDLAPGARAALIGPNGAGKTTLVNLVTGALVPDGGRVALLGEDVTRLGVEARAARGLGRSFQVTRPFRELTAREGVALAARQRRGEARGWWAPALAPGPALEEADALLAGLGLSALADRLVGTIAYGEQRLVELAMALALRPKVLLLDEPAAGVPRDEAPRLLAALDALPADVAVLLIEHDMDLVFRFARRVVVLAAGAVVFDGAPGAAREDAGVRAAYLGSYGKDSRGEGAA